MRYECLLYANKQNLERQKSTAQQEPPTPLSDINMASPTSAGYSFPCKQLRRHWNLFASSKNASRLFSQSGSMRDVASTVASVSRDRSATTKKTSTTQSPVDSREDRFFCREGNVTDDQRAKRCTNQFAQQFIIGQFTIHSVTNSRVGLVVRGIFSVFRYDLP
jgi:hypothetical protein